MAELFRLRQRRYFNASGIRCEKSDPTATAKIVTSGYWYADLQPTESVSERLSRRAAGIAAPKRKRVRLCKTKRAATKMLAQMTEETDKASAGIQDYQLAASQELGPLVDEFRKHMMKSGKKRTEGYVDTTLARIEKVFKGCVFDRLFDIDCAVVEDWLFEKRSADVHNGALSAKGIATTYKEIAASFGVSITTVTYWRRKGAPIIPRSKNDLSAIAKWHSDFTRSRAIGSTTSDHYVTALKRFGNWLVRPGKKVDVNPFADLGKLNDDTDLRKKRRVLPPEQFANLIETAAASRAVFRGIDGFDRATIYILASFTGLRAGEIGSLNTDSFDFGESPTVTVEGAYTKNGELAVIPLHSEIASRLEKYIQELPTPVLSIKRPPTIVWPGKWSVSGAQMIKIDLLAAGIPYTDSSGKDYDFHALRHQFITNMARAGVSLRSAQELARHSKPELTANIYTHLTLKDTAADIEKLASPPVESWKRNESSGTSG